MHCCCGHGPWCHWGYGYGPPPYGPGPYGFHPRRRGRWTPDEEDLEDYLEDLEEEEVARVRRDFETARRSRSGEA